MSAYVYISVANAGSFPSSSLLPPSTSPHPLLPPSTSLLQLPSPARRRDLQPALHHAHCCAHPGQVSNHGNTSCLPPPLLHLSRTLSHTHNLFPSCFLSLFSLTHSILPAPSISSLQAARGCAQAAPSPGPRGVDRPGPPDPGRASGPLLLRSGSEIQGEAGGSSQSSSRATWRGECTSMSV
jgi:hypothetical protein